WGFDSGPLAQRARERAVEPRMDRQALEPGRRPRPLALGGIQRCLVGKLVQRIELAAFVGFLLDEPAAVPERAFEQDRKVLVPIPREELLAKIRGRPK